jgi:hypothetical protein
MNEAAGTDLDDVMPKDVFAAKQRQHNQKLLEREEKRLAEIEEELKDPDLTKKERKQLEQMRTTSLWAIDERRSQLQ